MYSYVEMFDNPWLPEQKVLVSPWGKAPPAIFHAAMLGDLLGVQDQLSKEHLPQRELDRALFEAIGSAYDNSAVINALVHAGADVNARGPDRVTPLIAAVARPCNIRALLNAGADIAARDKWDRDALQLAREIHEPAAIQLLQHALPLQ